MNKALEIKQTINELRVIKDAYFRKVNRLEKKLNKLLNEQDEYLTYLNNLANPKTKDDILNMDIFELDLSVRAFNLVCKALHTIGVKYDKAKVKDLVRLSEDDFFKMRNCGQKSFSEIKFVLESLDLELNTK